MKKTIHLTFIIVICCVQSAFSQKDSTALAVLAATHTKYESYESLKMTIEVTIAATGIKEIYPGTIYIDRNKFRIDNSVGFTIYDGIDTIYDFSKAKDEYYMEEPDTNVIHFFPYVTHAINKFLEKSTQLSYKLISTEGKQYYLIKFNGLDSSTKYVSISITIDSSSLIIQQIDITDINGLKYSVIFTEFIENPDLDGSLFVRD